MRLIDANKLLSDVDESLYHNNHTGEGRVYHRHEHAHFAYMIEMQPTIEAVPVKRGKWIEEKTMIGIQYKCSNCGGVCERYSHKSYKTPPYCMHCGADMRWSKNDVN